MAVGEDAFTHTLSGLSKATNGRLWIAEDFRDLTGEISQQPLSVSNISDLRVHDAPAELPSARPTWSKESQMMHVAVVSQNLYQNYRNSRRAFVSNLSKNRESRTALFPIESDVLAPYRERRAKTSNAVAKGEAILLDRSYRDFFALNKNSTVRLTIY